MCDCDEKPKPTPLAQRVHSLDRDYMNLAERVRELESRRWRLHSDLRRCVILLAGGAALYLAAIGLHSVLYR